MQITLSPFRTDETLTASRDMMNALPPQTRTAARRTLRGASQFDAQTIDAIFGTAFFSD